MSRLSFVPGSKHVIDGGELRGFMSPEESMNGYRVMYSRSGSVVPSEDEEWVVLTPTYPTKEEAMEVARKNVRMGYPTYVRSVKEMRVTGIPSGPSPYWDYENIRWKRNREHID